MKAVQVSGRIGIRWGDCCNPTRAVTGTVMVMVMVVAERRQRRVARGLAASLTILF